MLMQLISTTLINKHKEQAGEEEYNTATSLFNVLVKSEDIKFLTEEEAALWQKDN